MRLDDVLARARGVLQRGWLAAEGRRPRFDVKLQFRRRLNDRPDNQGSPNSAGKGATLAHLAIH